MEKGTSFLHEPIHLKDAINPKQQGTKVEHHQTK